MRSVLHFPGCHWSSGGGDVPVPVGCYGEGSEGGGGDAAWKGWSGFGDTLDEARGVGLRSQSAKAVEKKALNVVS